MALIRSQDLKINRDHEGVAITAVNHKSNGSAMLAVADAQFDPGAAAPPHACTNTEESIYVLAGSFKFVYNGEEVDLKTGECIHYPANVVRSYTAGNAPGRLVFISPHPEPIMEFKPHPSTPGTEVGSHIFRPGEEYEFVPGVWRHDFTSAKIGAVSTFASDVRLTPGNAIPVHYHPEHDESMYCLDGDLVFTYGDETLHAKTGDVFLGEVGIPHGVRNEGTRDARMFAIHPTTEPKRIFI